VPDAALLETHAIEQAAARRRGRPALVVGGVLPKQPRNDRLFDRLIRETALGETLAGSSVIERTGDTAKGQDLACASTLNLSAPRKRVKEIGGFVLSPGGASGYEDVELAFGLSRRFGMCVLHCPDARVEHDHRVEPDELLSREYMLGFAAPSFARLQPECCRAMFGRDVLAPQEIYYAREYVTRECGHAARLRESLEKLAMMPAALLDGDRGGVLRRCFSEQYLPLKRWAWRAGLIDALAGRAANPLRTREPMAEAGKRAEFEAPCAGAARSRAA
jgi:hypothetical protein